MRRNRNELNDIENLTMLAVLMCSCTVLVCALCTGCAVNPETGATEVLGAELPSADAALGAVEGFAEIVAESGGVLGIVATAVAGGIAWWRNRKASSNLAAAASLATVIEEILSKAKAVEESGAEWKPTKEELKDISKRVLAAAGTQADVQALLEKLGFSSKKA